MMYNIKTFLLLAIFAVITQPSYCDENLATQESIQVPREATDTYILDFDEDAMMQKTAHDAIQEAGEDGEQVGTLSDINAFEPPIDVLKSTKPSSLHEQPVTQDAASDIESSARAQNSRMEEMMENVDDNKPKTVSLTQANLEKPTIFEINQDTELLAKKIVQSNIIQNIVGNNRENSDSSAFSSEERRTSAQQDTVYAVLDQEVQVAVAKTGILIAHDLYNLDLLAPVKKGYTDFKNEIAMKELQDQELQLGGKILIGAKHAFGVYATCMYNIISTTYQHALPLAGKLALYALMA